MIFDLYEAIKKFRIRDKKGYRNLTENKNIILTIGYHYDQRYISEEYTKNLINNKIKIKYPVVNGGSGQSLVGHIYSTHNGTLNH